MSCCVTVDTLLTPTARMWEEGGKAPQIFRCCDKQETKPIPAIWGSQPNHKDTKENLKKDIKTYIQRGLVLTSISPPNSLYDIVVYMTSVVTRQKGMFFKPKKSRFRLDILKKLFPVGRLWHRVLRGTVAALSLEVPVPCWTVFGASWDSEI